MGALDGIHLILVTLVDIAYAIVLRVKQFLWRAHTVVQLVPKLEIAERLVVVALCLFHLVLELSHLRLVFQGMDVRGNLLSLLNISLGFVHVALRDVHVGQSYDRLQPVPLVARFLHHLICILVFRDGFIPLAVLLVELSEVGVAQTDTQV